MFLNVSRILSLIGPWPDDFDHPDYHRNQRLRALLKHAGRHCPYYRDLFRQLSLKPSDITTPEDLKRLPILTRNTVRTRAQEIVVNGTNLEACRIERTNGTTGEPTKIYNSSFEVWFQHALWITGYLRCGMKPWHRQAKFMMGSSIPSGKKWFQKLGLFRRAYMSVAESPSKKIQWLREYKPDVLFTWGSVLNEISSSLQRAGEELHLPLIITSSDIVLREQVASRIKGRLLDIYGATETGPLAWPCLDENGFHIDPRWVIVEIVNEKDEPADRGQIVCTPLWRRTMPLIRYQLDDICEWDYKPCHCGCTWPKIKSLIGRQSDLFTLPSGENVTTGFAADALRSVPGIEQFQLVQKSPLENFMFIVPGSNFNQESIEIIQQQFATKLGKSGCLNIKLVSSLYRPPTEKFRSIYTLMGVDRMREKGVDVDKLFHQ